MATSSTAPERSTHRLRFVVFLLIALLSGNASATSATEWLIKISAATAEVSFSGVFVYTHNGQNEVMKIARRVTKDGMMQEHLRAIVPSNEPAKEVVRDMDNVWYYVPDQNIVVHERRQTHWGGFPKILAGDIQQIKRNYRFTEGAGGRIANRLTHKIDIVPNDDWRYGYSLWADSVTGLLLRSDLINKQNEVIEKYLFVDIEIGEDITDEQLAAVNNKDEFQSLGNNVPVAPQVKDSHWRFAEIADGYTLSNHIRRVSAITGRKIEHIVYTDGLSSISIFIQEKLEAQPEMVYGVSRIGSMHTYYKRFGSHLVVVMGEVPAKTVECFAESIIHLPRAKLGF